MESVRSSRSTRVDDLREELEERVAAPMLRTGRGFYALAGILLLIVAWGVFAYFIQAKDGLFVTDMRDRVSWGLYIALFVFFIGASMAGTFVSAVLRLTKAPWRTPVVRSAEMLTVAALIVAGLFIAFDLGRPDRMLHLMIFGRWESPLIWDVYGLAAYLMGSVLYLYGSLIPDLAYLRDRIGSRVSPLRRWFYETSAINWRGTPNQRKSLTSGMTMMTILIVPVAVMMHTVTSWIFAMTLREPWDSPMFGIYFVAGAIFSGTGLIIVLLAVLRRMYGLESFLTKKHFIYLGYILATFAAIMFFFNLSELVTHGYKLRGQISTYLEELLTGDVAPLYWTYLLLGLLTPLVLVALPFTRNIIGMVCAAVAVNIAMFLERYLIVVGGMRVPLNPYELPSYSPTWVEWSLMAGGIALFVLIVMLMLKLVPNVAITDMLEEYEESEAGSEVVRPVPRSFTPSPQPAGGGN